MISKIACYFLLTLVISLPAMAEIKLQRYSISTYSNTNALDKTPGYLSGKESNTAENLSVIRVGFRQYSNPNINSSSFLSLENRLTLMDDQTSLVYGQILFYPNPFRLKTGAQLSYVLNQPSNIEIHIFDMFGHRIFKRSLIKGMDGAKMGTNNLIFDASVFNYYNVPAGIYFLYIFDDQQKLIGKTKFAIVP